MVATDVNEAFAGEKAGQIALAQQAAADAQQRIADFDSGKTQAKLDAHLAAQIQAGAIRMTAADRYEVLTGYDAGEQFTVRRATRPQEVPLILPEHGLDEHDGKVSLYSAVPAWHSLGQVIPGGTSDVEEVIRLAGIGFGVDLRQVRYHAGDQLRTDLRHHVTVRDDTHEALGVVGSKYTPIQNRAAFAFLQELVASGDVTWESAGSLRGGRRVFISMKLPETVTIDPGGIADEIVPFIVAINSHDGTSPFQVVATPWRPVCGNTERFAVRDAWSRWTVTHTKSAENRIAEAQRTLGLSLAYYDAFAEEETRLAQAAITTAELDALIAEVWEFADDDPTERQQNYAGERASQVRGIFAAEAQRVGPTAYAAERAITAYLDHVAPKRALDGSMAAARATAILEDTTGDLKSRAHKLLLRTR
jgi:phage/plasmid-like protein (TIGR03299 family)